MAQKTTIYGGKSEDAIFTLLVTGSRDWTDCALVLTEIKHVAAWCEGRGYELHVVHGGADGADTCADKAAQTLQVPCHRYPAPWRRIGRSAGPQRNRVMKQRHEIDAGLAFHDNIEESTGTADMIDQLERDGVDVKLVTHAR